MAKAAKTNKSPRPAKPKSAAKPSKLDQLVALLQRAGGAAVAEMMAATGWQQHSVRGAMAGALRKRGHDIVSEKSDASAATGSDPPREPERRT